MREVAFIKKNKKQWLDYEKAIYSNQPQHPDYLSEMYIQLMNDLSYAQTFYPDSKITLYLNNLAGQTYQKIYKVKRIEENRIIHFFKTEVPLLVYEHKAYMRFTLLLFTVTLLIGFISAHYDFEFTRLILGNHYIDTTLENIKSDDVMGIYKSGSNWGSFIGITANNLYVGLRFFIFGIFGGLGTFYYLLQNGVMLATFQYIFIKEHVFMDSFRGIWLHGALEITSMVVEAFAGFILGGSLLFPKTYSRINAMKRGFKTGLKIFIATTPFTIVAGFIEGFITRYAKEMPDVLNYLIIFGTLFCIIYYFFIYPKKVSNKHTNLLNSTTHVTTV